MLEEVVGSPRRPFAQSRGVAADAIAALKPIAWWRMDEMAGPHAVDSMPNHHDAVYEPGVVFFLEGPKSELFCRHSETNRCAHFAGGRMSVRLPELKDEFTISMWLWNGMPNAARGTSGWLLSRDSNHGLSSHGDHLGIGGTMTSPGKLVFQHGDGTNGQSLIGKTTIDRWTWNHVVIIRKSDNVSIYLNGSPEPEIQHNGVSASPLHLTQFFFGGRSDNTASWEGRLDEIAVFDRALIAGELLEASIADSR